jgi:carboxymethylenebutenolidase
VAERISLTARDGHAFACWRSDPKATPLGGIVVLHAVYGLTAHMGGVCDAWAAEGFAAIAPSLFDRVAPGIVHPYARDGVEAGRKSYAAAGAENILSDIEACRTALADIGPVAVSGFCTGGTWAWTASARLPFDAQVNFYGSHVPARLDQTPLCPTIMHYGDADFVVPVSDIEKIRSAHPEVTIHVHAGAGHAFFNPDQPEAHRAGAAAEAWRLSVAFMRSRFTG